MNKVMKIKEGLKLMNWEYIRNNQYEYWEADMILNDPDWPEEEVSLLDGKLCVIDADGYLTGEWYQKA